MQLLLGRAGVLADMRDIEAARADVEEAHDAGASSSATRPASPAALLVRGEVERDNGDLAMARRPPSTEAVEHFRALGDEQGAADAIREIGMAQIFLGDNDDAERRDRGPRSAASARLGDRRGEAWALQHLAWISFVEGRVDEAESRIDPLGRDVRRARRPRRARLGHRPAGLRALQPGRPRRGPTRSAPQVLVEARERGDRWGEGMMLLLGAGRRAAGPGTPPRRCRRPARRTPCSRPSATASARPSRWPRSVACLVTTGRVDDGLAMLSEAYDREPGRRARRPTTASCWPTALAGAAVAVGDPDVALGGHRPHRWARSTTPPASAASSGSWPTAWRWCRWPVRPRPSWPLRPSAEGTADVPPAAYAQSALALALATVGERDEVLALADEVDLRRPVHLPRPRSPPASRPGWCSPATATRTGLTRLSALVETVDATEDEVAKAVARMAEAAALAAFDLPSAAEAATRSTPGSGRSASAPRAGAPPSTSCSTHGTASV